jgi:hypothetical protein
MKIFFSKKLLVAGCALILAASCKKNDDQVYFQGGSAPTLKASVSDSIPLNFVDSAKTAVTFSWTNPNYNFSNGISSLDVTYDMEIDTVGANFKGPNKQDISISSDLGNSYTVQDFNALMANKLLLTAGQPHQIQVRLSSFLVDNQATLTSNTLTFKVTPYAPPPAVTPPSTGTLYIVGSATPGGGSHGWDNPITNSPINQQQFTQISPTEYKITIPLIGGGEYKLIAVNGSWNEQWSVATSDTYPNGGPFVFNGGNSIAPAASGTYTIDVNFQIGKFTVTQ